MSKKDRNSLNINLPEMKLGYDRMHQVNESTVTTCISSLGQ
jgi:hypothetical protein